MSTNPPTPVPQKKCNTKIKCKKWPTIIEKEKRGAFFTLFEYTLYFSNIDGLYNEDNVHNRVLSKINSLYAALCL